MRRISKKLNIAMAVMLIFAFITVAFGTVSRVQADIFGIQEEKTVIVGFFDDDNPNFISGFSDDERKSGYAYEYCQDMAGITGWKYEYVYGTWNEIYNLLVAGKIDMMVGVGYTDSRAEKILYTKTPMIDMKYRIYCSEKKGLDVDRVETLQGMKVAVRNNSVQADLLESFLKENNISCTVIKMNTEKECRNAVNDGSADAFVASTIHNHDELKPFFNIGDADCYTAFAPGREALLQEFNLAQDITYEQTPYYNYLMEEKYFHETIAGVTLTDIEKNWLQEKKYLTIGISKNDLPLAAMDEEGNATGLAAEIINFLEEFFEIPIKVVGYESTAVLEKAVVNSEIDAAFPMFCDSWYAESGGYLITNSVLSERAIIVYKGEFSEDKYKSVAVSTGSVSNRFLVDMYFSDVEQKVYSSREEYINAVLNGEAGFAVGSSSVLTRFLETNEKYEELKTALLSTELSFCFAVSPDSHSLVAILNKGIRNLEEGVVTNAMIKYSVVDKKATLKNYVKENTLTVVLAVLVFLSFIVVALLVVRDRLLFHKKTIETQGKKLDETQASLEEALQNEVKAKTDLARALQDQNVIYSELLRMESGGVVAVDWDTKKLVTVNEAALHIFGFRSEQEALGHNSELIFNCILEEVREAKRQEALRELSENGGCVFEAPVIVDGDVKYFLQQSVLRKLANGQNICLISITDITESKMLELELQTASRIDALSCVNNRGWGEKLINDAILSGKGGMFCLLDINKFKSINDTYGHQCGDQAIRLVASAMKECFRDDDIVLRLGGDEFAVFAVGVHTKEEGAAIISRFFNKLEKDRIPDMGDRCINVSLGACICLSKDISFDDMYRMADSQMYKCKEKPGSNFIFF